MSYNISVLKTKDLRDFSFPVDLLFEKPGWEFERTDIDDESTVLTNMDTTLEGTGF